jgi:hypothetical protein
VFKGGQVVDKIVGAVSKSAILAKLEPHMAWAWSQTTSL